MLTYGWEFEASILSPVNAKTKVGKTWLSANLPSWKLAFVCAPHELERTFRKLRENSKNAKLFPESHTVSDVSFFPEGESPLCAGVTS